MEFRQLVHTLSYGDATSGAVLAMHRCFLELGAKSEIYALNIHDKYKDIAHLSEQFPVDCKGEVILHYSLGSPLNNLYKSIKSAKRCIVYHNITPSHWFQGVNLKVANDIEKGISDLSNLCAVTDRIVSVSNFNAEGIKAFGFDSEVLPLVVDPERWNTTPNEGIRNLLNNDTATHLLHIGRIAPNKCIEDVIKIFYFYHYHINKNSKLWIVGINIDTEIYCHSLQRMASELFLDDAVFFTGGLSDEEVRSFYECSDLYITMSEHEGFCMPIVEAMYFGLPVLAYAEGAIPETLKDGGILVREKRHAEIAELIGLVIEDSVFKNRLIEKGKQRSQTFSLENFKQRIKEVYFQSQRAVNAVAV